jgi:hypothetical protein
MSNHAAATAWIARTMKNEEKVFRAWSRRSIAVSFASSPSMCARILASLSAAIRKSGRVSRPRMVTMPFSSRKSVASPVAVRISATRRPHIWIEEPARVPVTLWWSRKSIRNERVAM